MSNPTLLVASLDGSLAYTDRAGSGALTGVDPIRYDSGLWLEEAGTNLVRNPVAGLGTTANWITWETATISNEASLPAAIPDEYQPVGISRCFKVVFNSDTTGFVLPAIYASAFSLVTASYAHTWLVYVQSPYGGSELHAVEVNFGVSAFATGALNLSLTDQWQRVEARFTLDGSDNTGNIVLGQTTGTLVAGTTLFFVGVHLEEGAYATSRIPQFDSGGALLPGYAWTDTPHDSPSTRAASSASVATANHLDPSSGAIAFRITPKIETGVEELWGECGVKGAGTDHLRWGRDASTHPFVEWSSNDAAYQRLTASETLAAGTAYDLYFGHTGTVTSLAVDAGTLQTGTRAAVSGDFSTGDLTLESSAGGVIYQPFATFNRTLTAKEIATLNGKNNWTMKVLAGNPYINFQLRPY